MAAKSNIPKQLLRQLEAFLATRVKIEPRDERAKASSDDFEAFWKLVRDISEVKWEPSYDGFVPAEIHLVNRTIQEPSDYFPIPYDSNADFEDRMTLLTANLNMAAKAVDVAWQIHSCRLRRDAAATKEKS